MTVTEQLPKVRVPRIAAIIVSHPEFGEGNEASVTLKAQTIAAELIVVSSYVFPDKHVGTRIQKSINKTLTEFDWRSYDYLMRMDSDAHLPPNFIESALNQGGDIIGGGGSGQIFKTEVLKKMGGRWPESDIEDGHFLWWARMLGFQFKQPLTPITYTWGTEYTLEQHFNHGVNCYLIGNHPLVFLKQTQGAARKNRNAKHLIAPFGYAYAALLRKPKLNVANYRWNIEKGYIRGGLSNLSPTHPRDSIAYLRHRWLKQDFTMNRAGAKFAVRSYTKRGGTTFTATLSHERKWANRIAKEFRKGQWFLDAGANIGAYSLRAAAKGMRVLAFEPDPDVRMDLLTNIAMNPSLAERITVSEYALGEKDGTATLTNEGAGSKVVEGRGRQVSVRALDGFDYQAIDLMKIDIEGYESNMIEGAQSTIRRTRPKIFVEVHRFAGPEKAAKVFSMLDSMGYSCEIFPVQETEDHVIARPLK